MVADKVVMSYTVLFCVFADSLRFMLAWLSLAVRSLVVCC